MITDVHLNFLSLNLTSNEGGCCLHGITYRSHDRNDVNPSYFPSKNGRSQHCLKYGGEMERFEALILQDLVLFTDNMSPFSFLAEGHSRSIQGCFLSVGTSCMT